MKKSLLAASFAATIALASAVHAATLTPLSTFGGGDGWLAPGEGGYTFLGTGDLERGLAYGNGHLYLVSRNGGASVRILNPATGAETGTLSVSGVTGGTFALNTIAVDGSGVIYSNNMTTNSTTSAFKVYSWATEASTPTVAYTGNGGLAGARVGDSLAANGSGSAAQLAAGYAATPVVAGNNGYAIVNPAAGSATAVGFTGTPPAAGDFRLGITFSDASHVLGSQGSSLYRYTSFSGSTGTLIASPAFPDPSGATADRLMSFAVIGGVPLLAVQSTGDGHVSIYDVTNPASPVYLTGGRAQTGTANANANGAGQLAWAYSGTGAIATLYAMNTNNGIQAFTFEVPEPASLLSIGAASVLGLRRRK